MTSTHSQAVTVNTPVGCNDSTVKTVAFIDSPIAAPRGAIRINKTLSSGALTGGTAEFKIVGPAPATRPR